MEEKEGKKKKICCQQETTIGNKTLILLKSLGDSVDVTQSYLT